MVLILPFSHFAFIEFFEHHECFVNNDGEDDASDDTSNSYVDDIGPILADEITHHLIRFDVMRVINNSI